MPDVQITEAALKQNRLGQETSPYLIQHRDNPVHWQPWSEDVFSLAGELNKPVLLSVGYAACHWCHVMAHESFENPKTADLMNENFINIKLDREERPDLDNVYQSALQMMGQQGGWPLTMFLTPEGKPFWGGTYFPPAARYGLPGFSELLVALADVYQKEPDKVEKNVATLMQGLTQGLKGGNSRKSQNHTDSIEIDFTERKAAVNVVFPQMDRVRGGLSGAPKFPQVSLLSMLWDHALETDSRELEAAVILTLDHICEGGIYDHLGGGFARYSVDEKWLVPHFEKMLYDNAQLIHILSVVWAVTKSDLYRIRIEETIEWIRREMTHPKGGFYSAVDADSEGEEGKYYVWTAEELRALLSSGEFEIFAREYDVQEQGNREGKSILNRSHILMQNGRAEQNQGILKPVKERLLSIRSKRILPLTDDKILTDWNAMLITALVKAGLTFNRSDWLTLAKSAYAFLQNHLHQDGQLYHAWRRDKAQHHAMLEDYAQLSAAALSLHQAFADPAYIRQAEKYCASLEEEFLDQDSKAYYKSSHKIQDLILRPLNALDNATPSGNGVLMEVFVNLFNLTGKTLYRQRAENLSRAFSDKTGRFCFNQCLVNINSRYLEQSIQIVIVAPGSDEKVESNENAGTNEKIRGWLEKINQSGLHRFSVLHQQPGMALPANHPAFGKTSKDGKEAVYICVGQSCSLPIFTTEDLVQRLLEIR